MGDNKRAVNMEPHSVGVLLTEVVRAQLHGGLPSALLKRIRDGVDKFLQETTNSDERRLCEMLQQELDLMHAAWRAKEDAHFSM